MHRSVNKDQRQRQIIDYLTQSHYPVHIHTLAEIYQCSEKTIRRDVNMLIEDRHAPWFIHDNKVHMDKSRENTIELHGYWFNREEIESLFVLNQVVEQLSPGSLKTQIEPLQKRLSELLKNEATGNSLSQHVKLIEIADRSVKQETFQLITQALIEQKQLNLDFWNRDRDEVTNRTISPLQLVRYKDNWKIDAWCHVRKSLRTFSLEAVSRIQILDKPVKEISAKQIKLHFQSSYGIFAGKSDKQAILKFTPYAARWIQYETWHPDQKIQWDSDGSFQLQIPYHHDHELIQDILKYGNQVEVLAPKDLREKIQEKYEAALQIYSGT